MYFQSRAHAGAQLAEKLKNYRYENSIVISISEGGVLVGEQIAAEIHSVLSLLMVEEVTIPGENVAIGTIDHTGGFALNSAMSDSEIDDYYSEYHGTIDEQRREKFQKLNHLLIDGGLVDKNLVRDHTVIVVSDGLKTGAPLDAVVAFLKTVRIEKLVIATPIASVEAVDRMHVLADELHCLSVIENYIETDHYYDNNDVPTRGAIIEAINNVILHWK